MLSGCTPSDTGGSTAVACPSPSEVKCVEGHPCPEVFRVPDGVLWDIVATDDAVFWSEGDGYHSTWYRERGGSVDPLSEHIRFNLAVAGQYFYWADGGTPERRYDLSVFRAPKDASAAPTQLTDGLGSSQFFVDGTTLWWAREDGIWRMDLVTSEKIQIADEANEVNEIQTDNDFIYWLAFDRDPRTWFFRKQSKIGGPITTLWMGQQHGHHAVILPDAVYLATYNGIIAIDKVTGEQTVVVDPELSGEPLRYADGKLYWWRQGGLYAKDLTGAPAEVLVKTENRDSQYVTGFAIGGGHAYWSYAGVTGSAGIRGCEMYSLALE